MRLIAYALLTIGLLASAGCGTRGYANGSGTGTGGSGHAGIGLPF
jgi:hypothetical protein